MRAPRYRFPDQVRTTTRAIASRMIRDGTLAQTPEQLDAWIAEMPDVREALQKGGYNTAFTSHDLFPLLQVFTGQAGGASSVDDVPAQSSSHRWIIVLALGLLIVLLLVALATGALP